MSGSEAASYDVAEELDTLRARVEQPEQKGAESRDRGLAFASNGSQLPTALTCHMLWKCFSSLLTESVVEASYGAAHPGVPAVMPACQD